MAAIGEVASIAGLFSLAGQSVQAASSLYSFWKAYESIHPKIQEVTSVLEALHVCLSDVRRTSFQADVAHGHNHPEVAEIFCCVKSCYDVLDQIETRLDPIKTRTGGVGQKLKLAAQKHYFSSIYQQLSTHHQRLATLVSTATWYTSLETLVGIQKLGTVAIEIRNAQSQSTRQLTNQITSMDSSLQLYLSQSTASNDLLQHKVDAVLGASTSADTESQLAAMEARLASRHEQLQRSIDALQSGPRTAKLQHRPKRELRAHLSTNAGRINATGSVEGEVANSVTAPRSEETPESLMQLVDTAIIIRSRRGQQTYSLVAMEDPDFTAQSLPQKRGMVQHLQCLRLLLWLLRKDNLMTVISIRDPRSLPSGACKGGFSAFSGSLLHGAQCARHSVWQKDTSAEILPIMAPRGILTLASSPSRRHFRRGWSADPADNNGQLEMSPKSSRCLF